MMPSSPRRAYAFAPALALAAGAFGCSAPVVDDVADASFLAGNMTQAIVLVDRVAAADGVTQTNVSAKFMRLSSAADPEAAERVVGSRLDLPSVGECVVLAAEEGDDIPPSIASLGSIELLDAGDVTLSTRGGAQVGGAHLPLAARAFPDVGDLVSGVFYTSRDAQAELPAPATYLLETTGSAALEGFAIEAEAPTAPDDVRIDGEPLDGAEGVTLTEGADASVRWRALSSGAHDELVYVDVTSVASGTTVRCAFNDVGEGTLPASFLRAETFGPLPASATIGLHRVRLGSFGLSSATGAPSVIDQGDIRFDLGVIGRLTLQAPR